MRALATLVLLLAALPIADAGAATPRFEGRPCKPPQGHRVTHCRYRAFSVNVRGHGCAASADQAARFTLVQFIAGRAPSGGGQGFLDSAALDASALSGRAALTAFVNQRGGGNGCGPARREIGRVRRLADPRLPRDAHARLSNGQINNAKREFGDVVYFMSNTTSVFVGGIARGMVRVGTRAAKADALAYCDPNSDGTLIWRYWSIRTRDPANPRLYGWIPGRCPAALADRRPS